LAAIASPCAVLPVRDYHPGIKRRTDDSVALNDQADLGIVELPVPGYYCAAIIVAR
jgi:hypothetical protein